MITETQFINIMTIELLIFNICGHGALRFK